MTVSLGHWWSRADTLCMKTGKPIFIYIRAPLTLTNAFAYLYPAQSVSASRPLVSCTALYNTGRDNVLSNGVVS